VALERVGALELPGPRFLESLGGAAMGFEFWHRLSVRDGSSRRS
jgi:hypothetical protein